MGISFSDYATVIGGSKTQGRALKAQSDMVMLNTWDRDIQAQTCFVYDYYHDLKSEERFKLEDLHPEDDDFKMPLDIKFIRHQTQTYDKDMVTFWLQLKPGQECNLDYYDDVLGKRYKATFPIGTYVDIMQEDGKYYKWLVVDRANWNGNQFPTFEILRCDKVFQWVHQGKKYQCSGVLRSQNSYNSGLWTDYRITSVEDQQKFAVPMTRDTETLFYNHRLIIDTFVESEPRAWLISKVNRISPNGICRVTLTQDTYDQHKDYIEHDEDGNIVGMWANWFSSTVEPEEVIHDDPTSLSSSITCSGKQQIRIGGSAKTLTVTFYDQEGVETDYQSGEWSYTIDDADAGSLLTVTPVEDGKIKLKFEGDDSYIGKILKVTFTSGEIISSLEIEILPL